MDERKGNEDMSDEAMQMLYRLILEYIRKGEFFKDPKHHQEFIENMNKEQQRKDAR